MSRPSTAASADTPPSSLASPLASPNSQETDHDSLRPGYHKPHKHSHHTSKSSLDTLRSAHSARKEYLDSLPVPSPEERDRINHIQLDHEAEHKRRSRDLQRTSMDGQAHHHHHHQSNESIPEQGPGQKGKGGQNASLAYRLTHGESVDDILRAKSATTIQRHYRGYRARRQMRGYGVDSGTRWTHAIREVQYRAYTRPKARAELELDDGEANEENAGANAGEDMRRASARQKWKKAAVIAKRAGLDQDSDPESDSDSSSSFSSSDSNMGTHDRTEFRKHRADARNKRRKESRMMGLQYFLEMVDLKHRYGSNLRTYHEQWKKADTHENFFYWLDHGEGLNLDLPGCPRERLDREQVRYLSREERQHYLVQVDGEGRLVWAKNGQRIDTTEKWKDSIHGIVPANDSTPAFQPTEGNHTTNFLGDSGSDSDSSSTSESSREADRAAKYATPGLDSAKGVHKLGHVSASTIFNKLLRKSVRKNTWIFVADTSFRLYVGIKNSGAFQHSSFLQGGRISAAGLIKIKNGRLTSLSPLSGHYRPPAANFRAFVRSLREEGADMSRVSISKSYAVLVGLEAYLKTKRKGREMVGKLKKKKVKIVDPVEAARQEEEMRDKSESAQKEREILAEEEKKREENSTAVHVMAKLGMGPGREPKVRSEEEVKEEVESRRISREEKKERVLDKLDDYPKSEAVPEREKEKIMEG